MADAANFAARLQALRDAWAADLPAKLAAIEAQWRAWRTETPSCAPPEELHRMVHGLIGAAGSFGAMELSRQARGIERLIDRWRAEKSEPAAEALARAEEMIVRLSAFAPPIEQTEVEPVARPVTTRGVSEDHPCVLIVEDDGVLAAELGVQLGHFGYRVETRPDAASARQAIDEVAPAAVMVDVTLPDGQRAGLELLQWLHARRPELPKVVVSTREDFFWRLEAVRAGAEDYFVKPLDVARLVDRLDQLLRRDEVEPYRVLIVDDEPQLAERHALLLKQAGMSAHTVTQAWAVPNAMIDFHPDILLLDLYMTECSGIELANVLRQQEAYVGIPIVYLSSEVELDRQIDALRSGDYFLAKPVEAERLVKVVRAYAGRGRVLNGMMERDSLTGLFKHARIKEILAVELSRAQRTGKSLSVAMVDIDHFKRVNDRHGHMMGDRVIKAVARLMRQRVRKSDSLGRYGGEEFALIMPDCDGAAAAETLDKLRDAFASIMFNAEAIEFSVTLSGGVATWPEHATVDALLEAADVALYQSKNNGRNRITLAR